MRVLNLAAKKGLADLSKLSLLQFSVGAGADDQHFVITISDPLGVLGKKGKDYTFDTDRNYNFTGSTGRETASLAITGAIANSEVNSDKAL
jgi:hypothetical protein